MIVQGKRLPDGSLVTEKPTGRLRFEARAEGTHVVRVLQQQFERETTPAGKDWEDASTEDFWRDVPCVPEGDAL